MTRHGRQHVRDRRRSPHPDGAAARLSDVLLRRRPRRFRDQGRPRPGRHRRRPGRVRDHGPGAAGRCGADPGPPGGGQGRHPDERPGADRQQGVPVRARRHRAGRPADPGRRVRRRGGRRPGVHDQRAAPAAQVPRGLQVRRRRDARRHGARRPDRLLRGHRHGRVHRDAQHPAGHRAAPSRTRSPPLSHQRAAAAQKNGLFEAEITPVEIPQRKGDPVVFSTGRGHPRARPRPSRWASCAPPSPRTAPSPPAPPRRSPTVPRPSS